MIKVNRSPNDIKKYRPTDELYIACLDWDLSWYPAEVDKAISMWQEGKSLEGIAENFRRDMDEVAILFISLARQNRIKEKEGGLHGSSQNACD